MAAHRSRRGAVRVLVVTVLLAACSSNPTVQDGGSGCTYASCEAECIARGSHYASCGGGICHCTGDVDAVHVDDGRDTSASEDRGDADDSDTTVPPCDGYLVPNEERAGASPGVVCRRTSAPGLEESLLDFHGDGPFVVYRATPDTVPLRLWVVDRRARCVRLLDDLRDIPFYPHGGVVWPSLEGDRVAYVASSSERPGEIGLEVVQVRLASISTGEKRVLVETRETPWDWGHWPTMDSVVLRYPWVVWRDIREEDLFRWYTYGFNVETGERRNLSIAPPGVPADASGMWGSVTVVDLLDGVVVFGAGWGGAGNPIFEEIIQVNLATGEAGPITSDPASQWWPVITPRWIAYLDQRSAPSCHSQSPCRTDIYGFDRETGDERALVVAGNSMQGPWMDGEGDWLLYEDQRDGTDVTIDLDREQDMYAFHLPTMTEIRVTDWPGFEMTPKVYDRHDGTHGALFVEEIDYGGAIYRLWDCDLPEPTDGG